MKQKIIGIVGLGLMGGGITKNLVRKGYSVIVFDAIKEKTESFHVLGAKATSSVKELTVNSDIIITSLPRPEAVMKVYLEEGGIIENARAEQILIEASTIDPVTSESIEKVARGKRVGMLAVCLGKGPKQAEEGTLPLYIGGDKETYEKVQELLNDLGGKAYYLGGVKASTGFKLISNMVGLGNLALLAEGYMLSAQLGIPPEVFHEALRDSGAASYQLDLRLPMMIKGDYATKFAVSYVRKDVGLGLEMARQEKVPVPVSAVISQLYTMAEKRGWGSLDAAAIYKIYQEFIS